MPYIEYATKKPSEAYLVENRLYKYFLTLVFPAFFAGIRNRTSPQTCLIVNY